VECYIAAILHHLVDGGVTWIDTEADDISVSAYIFLLDSFSHQQFAVQIRYHLCLMVEYNLSIRFIRCLNLLGSNDTINLHQFEACYRSTTIAIDLLKKRQ
jgi:hypothetical protein